MSAASSPCPALREDNAPARPPDEAALDSSRLFADRKEVKIRHAGEVYRLRLTRNGKLILNK